MKLCENDSTALNVTRCNINGGRLKRHKSLCPICGTSMNFHVMLMADSSCWNIVGSQTLIWRLWQTWEIPNAKQSCIFTKTQDT